MDKVSKPTAACNNQKCWKLLANNVTFVCTGLNTLVSFKFQRKWFQISYIYNFQELCVLSQKMGLSNHLVTFDTYWVYIKQKGL